MAARSSLLLVVALLLADRPARAEDRWLGRDKGLHAAASAVIAAAGYAASAPWIERPAGRAAIGASLALGAGAAKELLWDAGLERGDPSWKDFTWDAIGAAVGVGVALLVDHATR
jgi:putative lipoprotein